MKTTEDKPKVAISVEIQCSLRYCVSITDKYRVEEPRYLWYCGTKKYRKGDGTGTAEKSYRGAAVVPCYRATLNSAPAPATHQQDLFAVLAARRQQASAGAGSDVDEELSK